ncbi:hemerythrin domain-containing protein [Paenibacillus tengchongensis]|uniref:hemerythrin domain-containing protein n=1 Tax=Paenibacillus tengchongensis TaxID=2608684 RepID=UPI00124DC1C1|nr:hemerythrin domain-containing protein [Paenibacillus tengchongensis]
MPGPSLWQHAAHHAIHEGGLSGAAAKTEEVEELLIAKEFAVARQAAEHLIEYWETRIISHADAEEEGFYQDMAQQNPGLADDVLRLARDHELMRIIVRDVKVLLAEQGLTPEVLLQFHALLVVNAVHSREEERLLFGQG